MKKFILAGFAAIAIAALAPQTQAAPTTTKHTTTTKTATHTQTKGASGVKMGGKTGGRDSHVAGKRADPHGRNVKVARDNRFGHDDQNRRDDRRRHDEQLRNDRLRHE